MTTKTEAVNLVEEEKRMDEEIGRLEAERRELEAPARVPTWDEIQTGAEDLEKRERRRGIIGTLIVAARVKRLQIRRERYEAELAPLSRARDEAYERLEAARTKRILATEEENAARGPYSDASMRIQSCEGRIKGVDREIRDLKGEGRG